MIKTLFFDLGNVLVSFSHEKMWKQLSDVCRAPEDTLKKISSDHTMWPKLEKGLLSFSEMIEIFERSLKKPLPREPFLTALSHIFSPMDTTDLMLQKLLDQGIELIMISNTCDPHFEYLKKHYSFISLFHHLVLSYKINLAKPDPNVYSYALSLTTATKEECFYIDDMKPFVDSALACGIAGHVYQSEALLKSTLISIGITL